MTLCVHVSSDARFYGSWRDYYRQVEAEREIYQVAPVAHAYIFHTPLQGFCWQWAHDKGYRSVFFDDIYQDHFRLLSVCLKKDYVSEIDHYFKLHDLVAGVANLFCATEIISSGKFYDNVASTILTNSVLSRHPELR